MKIYNTAIKILIYLTVFLIPLFFLPWTTEAFNFPKVHLLFFLISLILILWIARMLRYEKRVKFYQTPLDLPVLIFLAVSLISVYFSIDRNVSLFGFYGRFWPSLIGIFSLLIFFFLLIQILQREDLIKSRTILKLFFSASAISVFIAYGSVLGIWSELAVKLPQSFQGKIPGLFFQQTFNPTAGSLESLSAFLLPLIIFLTVYWVQSRNLSGIRNLLILGLIGFFFGILAFGDSYLIWSAFIVSLLMFLVFALKTKVFRPEVNRLLLPIFLTILASFLLLTNPSFSFVQFLGDNIYFQRIMNTPSEILPNLSESYKASFRQLLEKPLLGSGLGNYYYSFNKHRSVEMNKGFAWQLRFDRPSSHFAEIIATQGILGIISFLLLVGLFLYITLLFLRVETRTEERRENLREGLQLPVLFTAITFIILQFFYYQNLGLAFGFWLFLALGVISWQRPIREKEFSFREFPELSLVFSVILMTIIFLFFYCYYWQARIVLADINFRKATLNRQEPDFGLFDKAERLNPREAIIFLNDSRFALNQVLNEINKPEKDRDMNKIQLMTTRAIQKARRGYDISPNLINICENMATIYRDVQGLAQGAKDWAKRTFEECLKLEPANPVFYTELGRLFLLDDLNKAKEYFLKSIEMKQDYLPAHIQYAIVLEKENKIDDAIRYLEDKINNYPFNAELQFQTGRLYYNKGEYQKAQEYLEKAVSFLPNYSNALYSLALTYEKLGKREDALKQFKKVLELNPGNKDVENKIKELERKTIKKEKEEQEREEQEREEQEK